MITVMFSSTKFTEIYYMVDNFCKVFTLQQKKYMVEDSTHNYLNKSNHMSDTEIIASLSCYIRVNLGILNIIIRNMPAAFDSTFPSLCILQPLCGIVMRVLKRFLFLLLYRFMN